MDEQRYMVNFGLDPYYKDNVMKTPFPEKDVCPKFVSCFDESLNNVSTKKQLIVHNISFDENARQIKTNYIGSEFIGHGDAETGAKPLKVFVENKIILIVLPRFL